MITSCKECVFAQYSGLTQTGCAYNDRLSIYKERDRVQINVENDIAYYTISDICTACTKPNPKGMPPLDEVKKAVEDRLFIQNTFVLPVKVWDDKNIAHFIERGLKQEGSPELLIVFSKSVLDSQVHSIPHQIRTIKLLDDSMTNSILNFSIKQPKTTYITLLEPGKVIPEDLNYRINSIKNDELNNFYMIYAEKTYHGMVILKNLAKYKTLNEIIELRKQALQWTSWHQESV